MSLDEVARRDIEAARRRARKTAPVREAPPDPTELPILPASPLEAPVPADPRVGSHIPDSFLYTPSESPEVWLDVWERDVRFHFSSHRGLAGRLLVMLKRLFAPLVRAPLSDHFQRERISHIVMLRLLLRQSDEVRRYLRAVRDPYSYVRDWAVPDLLARMDAFYTMLDQRVDALEAGPAGRSMRGERAAPRRLEEAYGQLFAGRERVLALLGGHGLLAAALSAAGVVASEPAAGEDPLEHLGLQADASLGGIALAASGGRGRSRLVELVRLALAKLAPGAALALYAGPGTLHPEALELLLEVVGFAEVERLGLTPEPGTGDPRLGADLGARLAALEAAVGLEPALLVARS